MINKIKNLREEFNIGLKETKTQEELKNFENSFLGKKGMLSDILKGVKDLSVEDKKEVGKFANDVKKEMLSSIEVRKEEIEKEFFERVEKEEAIDTSLSFPSEKRWHAHPLSLTSTILEDIFISMGFKIADGPHIEKEEYNFDKLNIPDNHPARDVWDTFWMWDIINNTKETGERVLLRTHTSSVQAREMLKGELPMKILVPGRVFRYEQEDARHTSNFYQLEWLVIGEKVSFGDLKGTLETAMKKLLGEKTEVRFRPSIFPFTEPSAEVDVSCQICSGTGKTKGKACSMCSGTGWVELLGSGMVHPKVLSACGIDPEKYTGFAFGMGIDRIATQRFKISSSRNLYQSKLKLNKQF